MADTYTTYYNLTKPQIGGDPDTWGNLLNSNFDTIDSQLHTASTYALPLVGGTLTGTLTIGPASGDAQFVLNKSASGGSNRILGNTAGVNRWEVLLGNNTSESGSNAGSDLNIYRFSDAGAAIDAPFSITRNSGAVSIGSGGLTVGGACTVNGACSINGAVTINSSTQPIITSNAAATELFLDNTSTGGHNWVLVSVGASWGGGVAAGALAFYDNTSGGTRGFFDTSGNLTVSPGNVITGGSFGSTSTNWIAGTNSAGTMYFRPNGYGSTTNQMTLNSSGVCSAADFQATSDERLKTNTRKLRRGIAELKRMLPREYIKGGREEIGFLAQEAQKVIPEAVTEGEDGYLRLSYGQVTALLARAILEVDARLELAGL